MAERPFGLLAGDRFRVADTDLWLTIEENRQAVGDEPTLSYGGTIRTFSQGKAGPSELDLVLIGTVIVDPVLGVLKADIGIKDGRVVTIGGVGRDVEIGPHTEPISCYGLIATPGVVDSHVHFVTPQIVPVALSAGVTTLITAGFDEPPYAMERFIRSFEEWPINIGLQANSRDTDPSTLDALLDGGAVGFKMHEDYGADAALIDSTLAYADAHDVSVALHTDGLNESVEIDDTVAAINGRTIHAYHVEGTGGGHVPDVIRLVREPNVICSSTTPTMPYGINAPAEHLPMTSVSHGLSLDDPDQAAMTRERIRPTTMSAEGPLHEMGAIQITNSDSQGMGRVGEVLRRTIQLAQVMKPFRGQEHDNERFLRYLAKCTIEPAITHGLSEHVGSLQPGRLADIVLWKPGWFGVKPEVVFKAGFPAWGSYGDGNATLEWSEPRRYRAGWGGGGLAPASVSVTFVSSSLDSSTFARKLGTSRTYIAVKHTRGLTRANLQRNRATAPVEVDPVDGTVSLDGNVVSVAPATELRLNRSHFLA